MNMTGVCNRSLTLTASYTRKPVMNVLNIFGRRSRNNVKALLIHPVKGPFSRPEKLKEKLYLKKGTY